MHARELSGVRHTATNGECGRREDGELSGEGEHAADDEVWDAWFGRDPPP